MIFAYRVTRIGNLHVANVYLQPDLISPIEERPRNCFRAWDEAYLKLKTNPDTTKIYAPEDLQDQKLMEFNTAGLASVRALPKDSRKSARVFTIAADKRPGSSNIEERNVWTNLPAWAHISLESQAGALEQIQLPRDASGSKWKRWNLEERDLYLHVHFFKNSQRPSSLSPMTGEDLFYSTRLGPQLALSNQFLGFSLRLALETW